MLFHQPKFAVFLIVVLLIYWLLVEKPNWRSIFLLGASYYFYMSWNVKYLALILGATVLNYVCGWFIHKEEEKHKQRLYLIISLFGSLGLLAFFKYAYFFYGSIRTTIGWFGWMLPYWKPSFLLPVGISFYIFQSMSYTIDVYRGQLEHEKSFTNFALYVAFFPQLVAGPIVRAVDFLPQLREHPLLNRKVIGESICWISFGLLKKIIIADYLAVNLIDRVFEQPHLYTSLEVLAGVYGYAFQIFCDFSGYSDIAIGVALLFGLRLPVNFKQPYLALGFRDFWRRWHITLSTWLRDYLYISLGGSRGTQATLVFALMMTMLLGGLWHGAKWTFVIWGAYHGILLATEHIIRLYLKRKQIPAFSRSTKFGLQLFGIIGTFHMVCLGWLFFRAKNFANAMSVIKQIFIGSFSIRNLTWGILIILSAAFISHVFPARWVDWMKQNAGRLPAPALGIIIAIVCGIVVAMRNAQTVPFIYFQF